MMLVKGTDYIVANIQGRPTLYLKKGEQHLKIDFLKNYQRRIIEAVLQETEARVLCSERNDHGVSLIILPQKPMDFHLHFQKKQSLNPNDYIFIHENSESRKLTFLPISKQRAETFKAGVEKRRREQRNTLARKLHAKRNALKNNGPHMAFPAFTINQQTLLSLKLQKKIEAIFENEQGRTSLVEVFKVTDHNGISVGVIPNAVPAGVLKKEDIKKTYSEQLPYDQIAVVSKSNDITFEVRLVAQSDARRIISWCQKEEELRKSAFYRTIKSIKQKIRS